MSDNLDADLYGGKYPELRLQPRVYDLVSQISMETMKPTSLTKFKMRKKSRRWQKRHRRKRRQPPVMPRRQPPLHQKLSRPRPQIWEPHPPPRHSHRQQPHIRLKLRSKFRHMNNHSPRNTENLLPSDMTAAMRICLFQNEPSDHLK